jgi:hypothetical protein
MTQLTSTRRWRGAVAALLLAASAPFALAACTPQHGKQGDLHWGGCGEHLENCQDHPTPNGGGSSGGGGSNLPQPQENEGDQCPGSYAKDFNKGHPHYAYDGRKKIVCKDRSYNVPGWQAA